METESKQQKSTQDPLETQSLQNKLSNQGNNKIKTIAIALLVLAVGAGAYYLGTNTSKTTNKQNNISSADNMSRNALKKAPTLSLQPFSPLPAEGKLIYAIAREDGNRYLEKSLSVGPVDYLMNPTKTDRSLQVSPDGKKIAFSREYWGFIVHDVASFKDSLIVKNFADFEEPTKNRSYSPYEWSPDSKKMLVQIGFWESSGLGVADIETKVFKEIKGYDGDTSNCLNGIWTPDSTKVILYGYNYGHPCNTMPGLHVASINQPGDIIPTPLYGTDKNEKTYSVTDPYSPDNKTVYFNAGVGIGQSPEDGYYSIPVQGGKAQKIQVNNLGKIWLNDSSYFYSTKSGIELYDMSTKTKKVVVENKDSNLSIYPVAVSPDKKYLAFVLSVKKYDQSGNPMYEDMTEENILKVISLDTEKVYDIDKNLHTESPVRWLQ